MDGPKALGKVMFTILVMFLFLHFSRGDLSACPPVESCVQGATTGIDAVISEDDTTKLCETTGEGNETSLVVFANLTDCNDVSMCTDMTDGDFIPLSLEILSVTASYITNISALCAQQVQNITATDNGTCTALEACTNTASSSLATAITDFQAMGEGGKELCQTVMNPSGAGDTEFTFYAALLTCMVQVHQCSDAEAKTLHNATLSSVTQSFVMAVMTSPTCAAEIAGSISGGQCLQGMTVCIAPLLTASNNEFTLQNTSLLKNIMEQQEENCNILKEKKVLGLLDTYMECMANVTQHHCNQSDSTSNEGDGSSKMMSFSFNDICSEQCMDFNVKQTEVESCFPSYLFPNETENDDESENDDGDDDYVLAANFLGRICADVVKNASVIPCIQQKSYCCPIISTQVKQVVNRTFIANPDLKTNCPEMERMLDDLCAANAAAATTTTTAAAATTTPSNNNEATTTPSDTKADPDSGTSTISCNAALLGLILFAAPIIRY